MGEAHLFCCVVLLELSLNPDVNVKNDAQAGVTYPVGPRQLQLLLCDEGRMIRHHPLRAKWERLTYFAAWSFWSSL